MPKRNKTRQEKIITELRRQLHSQPSSNPVMISPPIQRKQTFSLPAVHNRPTPAITVSHSYLAHDLIKTLIVTGVLVGIELVLYFLGKINIIHTF